MTLVFLENENYTGVYLVNLVSSLLISEVAIQQYESIDGICPNNEAVPSSFKDLADSTLGENAGTFISTVSILVNWCVLSFALMRVGEVVHGSFAGFSSCEISMAFAGVMSVLVAKCPNKLLCNVSSMAVTALFASFAGVLIPGLTHMQDPALTLAAEGTNAAGLVESVLAVTPIFLSTMVFQNIVPTVTKIHDFDRFKTVSSILIGSAIPLFIYVAWCLAVLGGGTENSIERGGLFLTVFSMASIIGSSLGGVMSLSSEIGSVLSEIMECDLDAAEAKEVDSGMKAPTIPSVLLATAPPLIVGILCSHGDSFTQALSCAGQFGSPLLYGIVPTALAWTQRNQETNNLTTDNNLVPGGVMTLAGLGALSAGFIGEELLANFGGIFAASAPMIS
eukprot:CAMPEP_0195518984 /NCGR_PEP_ID=MMETSP0794_2-20130614/14102_1 /TAXON_ID=515487 /ORGANISM="Stephanopyxis turris, Strain CCMP 815" /LENGTH=392 /DNA_ID=CAMNT_0040648051 /DNA_START=763 /DNA_END=1941 /DNA_ORIENTATION=-